MTDREAMQQALEALEASIDVPCYGGHPKQEAAAAALRAQLEQPEQKPLTTEERNWIVNEALRGHASTRDAIDWVIRQVERHPSKRNT